jgi:hypothetical protein
MNEAGQRQFPGPHAADGGLSLEPENAAAAWARTVAAARPLGPEPTTIASG